MTKLAIFRLLIIVLAVAAAFFVYRFFFVAGEPAEAPGVESLIPPAGLAPRADDEFLKLLRRLQGVELDAEVVFNHPVWESLENFRRELVPEPRGRRNPFAPTGFDAPVTTTPPAGGSTTTSGR